MQSKPRPLHVIAREIEATWPRPYFGAVPYIHAMRALNSMSDYCGVESAASIVSYFLANAGLWRGPTARDVKAELRGMLQEHGKKAKR